MNQYRCETCKKTECWINPIHEEEIMVKGTALVDPEVFCVVHEHTSQRGCASHSDFQNEQEKVLDELWQLCIDNGVETHGDLIGYPSEGFITLKLLKKIAELRQEGEMEK